MLEILTITGPIYLCIFLGYLSTRLGLFAKSEMRTLGKFVVNLAIPALLFNAIARRKASEMLHGDYLMAYGIGSLCVIGLGLLWYRKVRQERPTPSAVFVMGMSCANSGFVGYPIVLLTFAPVAGLVLALNMIIENVLVIPLMLALAERGRGERLGWGRMVADTLGRLTRNPMVLGVAVALVFSLLELRLPAAVARTVDLFALASSAISLFVIGGALVDLPVRGIGAKVAPIAFGKLVLHPLCVLAAATVLPLLGLPAMDATMLHAAVLMAAMPMMGIYPVLALAYGLEELCAATLLFTTVASFFTLNLLLWVLKSGALGA